MTRFRPLLLPLMMTVFGLAVLVSLGEWQLDRLEWKVGLIERIEDRANGEAVSLAKVKDVWATDQDIEYYRVRLTGRFLHEHERHLYTIVQGRAGWRIITPLETENDQIILVDRGFVPEGLKEPEARQEGQVEGTVRLTGLARTSETETWFTPETRAQANRWFRRDIAGMIESLPEPIASRALPFLVEAESRSVPGGWPRGGVTRLSLPNRHLEYAVTWFGLAATLLVIFIFYARHRLQQTDRRKDDAKIADESGSV